MQSQAYFVSLNIVGIALAFCDDLVFPKELIGSFAECLF